MRLTLIPEKRSMSKIICGLWNTVNVLRYRTRLKLCSSVFFNVLHLTNKWTMTCFWIHLLLINCVQWSLSKSCLYCAMELWMFYHISPVFYWGMDLHTDHILTSLFPATVLIREIKMLICFSESPPDHSNQRLCGISTFSFLPYW